MAAEIYEITPCPHGRLATMPYPRGNDWLEGEMASVHARGVTDLVSMLTPEEEQALGLTEEPAACAAAGLRFHRHPLPDRGVPASPEFGLLLDSLEPVLRQGGFVAVHCRGGIGRSSVVAAGLLVRLGVLPAEALASISRARGFEIPDTEEQRDFILALHR